MKIKNQHTPIQAKQRHKLRPIYKKNHYKNNIYQLKSKILKQAKHKKKKRISKRCAKI